MLCHVVTMHGAHRYGQLRGDGHFSPLEMLSCFEQYGRDSKTLLVSVQKMHGKV